MKAKNPFFYRIDLVDLFDFATEPEGLNMSLLEFVKELKKGESAHIAIQKIIDQTHNYMEMQKKRASAGGVAKAEKKLLKQSQAGKKLLKHEKSCLPLPNSSSSIEEEAEVVTETEFLKTLAVSDKPKRASAQKMTDEEWLDTLKTNPAYEGLNFDIEVGKAKAWADNKGRKCSRAFLLNWFNRAEKTVGLNGLPPPRQGIVSQKNMPALARLEELKRRQKQYEQP